MHRIHVGLLLAGIALSGATAMMQAPAERKPVPIAEAGTEFRDAIHHADQVIARLQQALLSELERELDRGGPAKAIGACHLEAVAAAHKIAREEGVASGRTSHRLRNPTNAPPAWAAPTVAAFAGRRAAGIDGFVVDLGDRIGVMRPIAQRASCLGCHGPESRIGAGVRNELKERYPADRAVGFNEGDLRGWFWVEVSRGSR